MYIQTPPTKKKKKSYIKPCSISCNKWLVLTICLKQWVMTLSSKKMVTNCCGLHTILLVAIFYPRILLLLPHCSYSTDKGSSRALLSRLCECYIECPTVTEKMRQVSCLVTGENWVPFHQKLKIWLRVRWWCSNINGGQSQLWSEIISTICHLYIVSCIPEPCLSITINVMWVILCCLSSTYQ